MIFRRRQQREKEIELATEAAQKSDKDILRVEEKTKKAKNIYLRLVELREENHFSPRIRAAYEGIDKE